MYVTVQHVMRKIAVLALAVLVVAFGLATITLGLQRHPGHVPQHIHSAVYHATAQPARSV